MQPVPVTCRREFITASLKSNRRSFDCVDRFAINFAQDDRLLKYRFAINFAPHDSVTNGME
jgi:hypothetical protein